MVPSELWKRFAMMLWLSLDQKNILNYAIFDHLLISCQHLTRKDHSSVPHIKLPSKTYIVMTHKCRVEDVVFVDTISEENVELALSLDHVILDTHVRTG